MFAAFPNRHGDRTAVFSREIQSGPTAFRPSSGMGRERPGRPASCAAPRRGPSTRVSTAATMGRRVVLSSPCGDFPPVLWPGAGGTRRPHSLHLPTPPARVQGGNARRSRKWPRGGFLGNLCTRTCSRVGRRGAEAGPDGGPVSPAAPTSEGQEHRHLPRGREGRTGLYRGGVGTHLSLNVTLPHTLGVCRAPAVGVSWGSPTKA